jgi:hypothetical protein
VGKKKARISLVPPTGKRPRVTTEIDTLDQVLFRWRVNRNYIDLDHEEWGWGKLSIQEFFNILFDRFNNYETMTWQEIKNRKNCHPIPVQDICSKAQSRLQEMQKDIDTMFQVDISELGRVFGYRDRMLFYLVWHDPNHTVCPFR